MANASRRPISIVKALVEILLQSLIALLCGSKLFLKTCHARLACSQLLSRVSVITLQLLVLVSASIEILLACAACQHQSGSHHHYQTFLIHSYNNYICHQKLSQSYL